MFLNFLLYLTFFFFSLGQVGRISLINGTVNFYLYEVLMVVFFTSILFKYRFVPLKIYLKKFKIFLILILIMFLSFLFSYSKYSFQENIIALLYLKRFVFYFFYFFYLSHWVTQEHRQKVLFKAIFLFIILTVLSSVTQYFFYPDLRNLLYLGWDPHLFRMFGAFFDTGVSGAIYGVILFYLYRIKLNRYLKISLLLSFFIFIVLTFSRSVYLGFLVTTLVILIKEKKWRELIIILSFFCLLVFFVPKPSGEGVNLLRVFSVNSRLTNYSQAISLWQKNWLVGIGYNHIRYVRDGFSQGNAGASFHSSFLIILVSTGIIGLVVFLKLLWQIGKINFYVGAIIIFLSILSLFDNILIHPFVLFFLLSIIPLLSR